MGGEVRVRDQGAFEVENVSSVYRDKRDLTYVIFEVENVSSEYRDKRDPTYVIFDHKLIPSLIS